MRSPLLSAIDHVVIVVENLDDAVARYQTLLGREAKLRGERDGATSAVIATANVAVELMSAAGDGPYAQRVRATLEADGPGLKSLVFAAPDIDAMHRRAERVGLAPEAISSSAPRGFRFNSERTHGVRLFAVEPGGAAPASPPAAVIGLDHVVIRTGAADRAAALYGARLGLDMRLDREVRGSRLMFFRCGDAIVEIAVDPRLGADADQLWGLSWRVADADSSRERLASAGLDVSEVRTGAKPGTRVFTIRDGNCGVPTLMIELSPKRD